MNILCSIRSCWMRRFGGNCVVYFTLIIVVYGSGLVSIDFLVIFFVRECSLCSSIVLFCIFVYLLFWDWCVVYGKIFSVILDLIPADRPFEELYDFGFLLCFIIFENWTFKFLSLVPVYDLFWFVLLIRSSLWLSFDFFILVFIWQMLNFLLLVWIVSGVKSPRSAKCSLLAGYFLF